MTCSLSSTQPAAVPLTFTSGGAPLLLVPVIFVGVGMGVPIACEISSPTLSPAPAPTQTPVKSASVASSATNATTPVAAATTPATTLTPTPAGAGLPAALVALLRGAEGLFLANEVFSVAPAEPLAPIEEVVAAPEWYAITRGRFVGVVDQFALSTVAITGVTPGACKAYTTQALALDTFNCALTWGGVQVA